MFMRCSRELHVRVRMYNVGIYNLINNVHYTIKYIRYIHCCTLCNAKYFHIYYRFFNYKKAGSM